MKKITRSFSSAAVAAAIAVTGLQASTAGAAEAAPAAPKITVAASDTSVSSGEQFVLTGRFTKSGRGLAGAVQVYTRSGDRWVALKGAKVSTRADGGYRVRVLLSATGKRQLRVVGDPKAAGLKNTGATTTVTVSR